MELTAKGKRRGVLLSDGSGQRRIDWLLSTRCSRCSDRRIIEFPLTTPEPLAYGLAQIGIRNYRYELFLGRTAYV